MIEARQADVDAAIAKLERDDEREQDSRRYY
ncbi:hypothetical protein SAMN05216285_4142 [Natrinema salifodinae]|uniref:Uncharacterized protein n=1 Tax=Natrinema salifodinae TaxID=1202768 RepID=A0A1I0QZ81_9EURY|nr:hypothetical protein SAMN05216285_4142 [Natrinema salifodinae]